MLLADDPAAAASPVRGPAELPFASLERLRRQFEDYRGAKADEMREQRQARLYYHGSQWSREQLAELRKRRQPATSTPALARKINGFVGLIERLRQDPKAFPRTPRHDSAAELCTAALRYALDEQEWAASSPQVSYNGAVDGIAGIEIGLAPGDRGRPGDYDVTIDVVAPETFFYDPRSVRPDFADARFMGVTKWFDVDEAVALFPAEAERLEALAEAGGSELSLQSDRERAWLDTRERQVRIVEHWYRAGGHWLFCFHCGHLKLAEGRSFLQDEKGRDACRFIMWSANVDQDGDRYGFVRPMKSLVDEINHRNSKALHLLNMRRIKAPKGAFDDIEQARRESVRPDGVIEFNPGMGPVEFDDAKTLADMRGQLDMQERARRELENFGPNPALVGQGVEARSGRAIALMQQAGMAELGPYIIACRSWKIRVYRAVWNAIRRHWLAERWIRVTDDKGLEQQVLVNGSTADPLTGARLPLNSLAALDVDIIIDEGPDAVNMQADALEVLQAAQAQGQQIPAEILIELLPLADSVRKRLLGLLQQARQPAPQQPQAAQAAQVQLAAAAAAIEERRASAALKTAQAAKAHTEAQLAPADLMQRANAERSRAEAQAMRRGPGLPP